MSRLSITDSPRRAQSVGIGFKLSLLVLAGAAAMFLAAFTYAYRNTRQMMLDHMRENARHLTLATVNQIESVFKAAEKIPAFIALRLERETFTQDQLLSLTTNAVEANPQVFGCVPAFEPYAFDTNRLYFAAYVCRGTNGLSLSWLENRTYHYFEWDWYLIPKELDRTIWSEPYFDEGGGNIIMTTCSTPFYRSDNGQRRLRGVIATDMALDQLMEKIGTVSIFKSGYAFLVSRNGVFVTHPDRRLIMRESIFSLAEAAGDPALRRIGQDMIRGGEQMVRIDNPQLGRNVWLYYAPLSSLGWSLGIVIPAQELYADVDALGWRMAIIGVLGLLGLAIVILLIARSITRPVCALARTTSEIAQGCLTVTFPKVRTHDEIAVLASSFEAMTTSLASLVRQVKEASGRIVSTTGDIATASSQQEVAVNDFGSSATEITAASKEIAATSRELVKTMKDVQTTADTTASLADKGRAGLGRMETSMQHMQDATLAMASSLSVIHEKSGRIDEMMTVINKVAAQTNLLSLNAAIEAEKAGEYGRGFAVVAREIRRLADQTAVATLDIRQIVKEMQSSVAAGVMEVDKFNREVAAGVQTVMEITRHTGQIIEQVHVLSPQFETVATGMGAQSAGAGQISAAMVQLSEGARRTADSLRLLKDATLQLTEAANRLQTEIARFKV